MWKYTLKVDGMMCGMCEAHVNDAIRKKVDVKKVNSSHTKGETVIVTEEDLSDAQIHEILDPTGYEVKSISKEEKKRGLFGW